MQTTSKGQTGLPMPLLEKMADVLRTLSHPHRLKIIEMLESASEAPVHEIMAVLELPQTTTSHHLNTMKRAGLIRSQRRGKEIWYRIADPDSLTILECIRRKQF